MGLWCYLERGGRRAIEIAHRRWGKDEICLHWAAVSAMQRPATYWHMLPEAAQARKAIWEAVNPHTGKRRIDEAFPHEIRESTREHEMMIRFINGATWQVVGSDNFNALVGSPPFGVVFSEFALANPAAWAYLRPILLENGGWAAFITTPRGKNHAHKLLQTALKSRTGGARCHRRRHRTCSRPSSWRPSAWR
jgi:phage terminase large subunit